MAFHIDMVYTFLCSFLCFFGIYKLLVRERKKESNEQKIEARIKEIAKQQEDILEYTEHKTSTFQMDRKDYFGADVAEKGGISLKARRIMKKAGITEVSVNGFMTICAVGGCLFAALIVYFDFLNKISGIPTGFCIGAYLVYNILASRAAKRKMQFLVQFPDAIDMMIRGVKAGLNIGRIMKLVSIESKDPLAAEFTIISQKFDLGVGPEKVLLEAAEKIDLEEFRFLVVALVLQMENGGVLAEILQNLSGIVRKRLELGLKLKAMSAEARMSAIVISALPFVFAGIMALVNPSHLKEFTTPGTGKTLFKIAITLFCVGTFFMLKATKIKV